MGVKRRKEEYDKYNEKVNDHARTVTLTVRSEYFKVGVPQLSERGDVMHQVNAPL